MTTALLEAPVIQLRDYQRDAVEAVRERWQQGVSSQLIAIPTGGGKTIIAGYLARELAMPAGWSTVMLVHRTELVRQSVEKFRMVLPDTPIGVVAAEQDQVGYPITVASVQTLLQSKRLARLCAGMTPGRLVISDEAHHDAAPGRRQVIDDLTASLKVGFTATPERADGRGLGAHYQTVAYAVSMLRLMAQNQLAPLTGLRIGTGTSLESVKSRDGDFAERELAVVCDSPARNGLIVRSWQQHAQGSRRRTVAFCVDVAHAEHLAEAFQDAGIDAESVVGTTPEAERRDRLARFALGQIPVLTSCMVLTEGYDEPAIDCILHARPTQSRPLYIQMTGRGARTAFGKQDCLVIDYVDNSRKFAIVSLDQLADDDPDALLEGRERREQKPAPGETFDLLALARERGPRKAKVQAGQEAALLYERSPLLWQEADGVRMARIGDRQYAVIQPVADGRYEVGVFDSHDWQRLRFERLSKVPLDLGYSMGIAEDTADRVYRAQGSAVTGLTRRNARYWQRSDPPTEPQINHARQLRIPVPDGITRQQLSQQIDLAHFAKDFRRWRQQGRLEIS